MVATNLSLAPIIKKLIVPIVAGILLAPVVPLLMFWLSGPDATPARGIAILVLIIGLFMLALFGPYTVVPDLFLAAAVTSISYAAILELIHALLVKKGTFASFGPEYAINALSNPVQLFIAFLMASTAALIGRGIRVGLNRFTKAKRTQL
jgi:hypothetical protein